MRALRFESGKLSLAEVPAPDDPAEARVRVIASGICNTDLEIVRGYAGFEGTIGHEFVGIAETAPGRPELIGKRVVGEINAGCGVCERCLAGDPRHCPTRTVLGIVGRDGAHAEYLSLPSANLLAVPDSIPTEEAVFAEPLAAAAGILEQVDIGRETRVAVIGDGKLGLLAALALGKWAQATLFGKHPEKLAICDAAGISGVVVSEKGSEYDSAFDVVVEASGSESGFVTAIDLVRPRGKIVLKSTFHGTPQWAAARVVVDEITIVGSRCGRLAPALELLKDRAVDVRPLISDEFALPAGVAAMQRAAEPGVLKVLLRP